MGQTVNSQVTLLDYSLPHGPEFSLEDVVPIHMKDWFEDGMNMKSLRDNVFSQLWLKRELVSCPVCFAFLCSLGRETVLASLLTTAVSPREFARLKMNYILSCFPSCLPRK